MSSAISINYYNNQTNPNCFNLDSSIEDSDSAAKIPLLALETLATSSEELENTKSVEFHDLFETWEKTFSNLDSRDLHALILSSKKIMLFIENNSTLRMMMKIDFLKAQDRTDLNIVKTSFVNCARPLSLPCSNTEVASASKPNPKRLKAMLKIAHEMSKRQKAEYSRRPLDCCNNCCIIL
jgi:hypothetical protein